MSQLNHSLGNCPICLENEVNAFFDCLTLGFCEDCIQHINICPNCDIEEKKIALRHTNDSDIIVIEEIKENPIP